MPTTGRVEHAGDGAADQIGVQVPGGAVDDDQKRRIAGWLRDRMRGYGGRGCIHGLRLGLSVLAHVKRDRPQRGYTSWHDRDCSGVN